MPRAVTSPLLLLLLLLPLLTTCVCVGVCVFDGLQRDQVWGTVVASHVQLFRAFECKRRACQTAGGPLAVLPPIRVLRALPQHCYNMWHSPIDFMDGILSKGVRRRKMGGGPLVVSQLLFVMFSNAFMMYRLCAVYRTHLAGSSITSLKQLRARMHKTCTFRQFLRQLATQLAKCRKLELRPGTPQRAAPQRQMSQSRVSTSTGVSAQQLIDEARQLQDKAQRISLRAKAEYFMEHPDGISLRYVGQVFSVVLFSQSHLQLPVLALSFVVLDVRGMSTSTSWALFVYAAGTTERSHCRTPKP